MSPFTLQELNAVIKRMKKFKASGPDEIPIEFYKWLDDENRELFLSTINIWWATGDFPNNKLKAHTASIYKKGDPKNQENYRPISLLNSCYKIYASLLQTRIANTIGRYLWKLSMAFANPDPQSSL